MADDRVKSELENLIGGGIIEKPVHEDITYGEVYENMIYLWNLIFFTGYFKKADERMGEDDTWYLTFTIPNREVRYIFHKKIMAWFNEKMKVCDLTRMHMLRTRSIEMFYSFYCSFYRLRMKEFLSFYYTGECAIPIGYQKKDQIILLPAEYDIKILECSLKKVIFSGKNQSFLMS